MDAAISALPIVVLIYLMTKKNSLPSYVALPAVAAFTYAVKLIYFESDPNLIHATIVAGLLDAWTPILIVAGAILLFQTMESSGSMPIIRNWLNGVSSNPVAQLMIIGWAFAFLIEGASGFGTPAALAAPILVRLGFDPLRIVLLTLTMNTVPVSFGAVGTPTWFGFGELGLDDSEVLRISLNTALIHLVASLFIPIVALLFVLDWKTIRGNLIFIYLSVFACVLPYVSIAAWNYEFPSLVGGAIGLVVSVVLARHGIGLTAGSSQPSAVETVTYRSLAKAAFPIWGSVLLLVVTRIPALGIRQMLTNRDLLGSIPLGSFGQFGFSGSLVLSLRDIFGTEARWALELLYIPALIPFFVISLITFAIFHMNRRNIEQVVTTTWKRIIYPGIALLGALVMVKLLMVGGDQGDEQSMVMEMGDFLATTAGPRWQWFAAYLGALGSFFSGSATVSNLTFGGIQNAIAMRSEMDREIILALQSTGAAMGNMVCINNIVAVSSILGIANREGFIFLRTLWPMLLYGFIAAVVGSFL